MRTECDDTCEAEDCRGCEFNDGYEFDWEDDYEDDRDPCRSCSEDDCIGCEFA